MTSSETASRHPFADSDGLVAKLEPMTDPDALARRWRELGGDGCPHGSVLLSVWSKRRIVGIAVGELRPLRGGRLRRCRLELRDAQGDEVMGAAVWRSAFSHLREFPWLGRRRVTGVTLARRHELVSEAARNAGILVSRGEAAEETSPPSQGTALARGA